MRAKEFVSTLAAAVLMASCQSKPPEPQAESKAEKQPEKRRPAESSRSETRRTIEIPAGTVLKVQTDVTVSTSANRAGDPFTATLVEPVVVGGRGVIPKGARFKGHVTTSDASGRLKGRAVIGVTLDAFELKGAEHAVATSLDSKTSEAHKTRNIEMIGGGAGLGALIGGIVGGGKGAAIGAAAGAGAGTAGAAATGRRDVSIPAETVLNFTLKAPVSLRE